MSLFNAKKDESVKAIEKTGNNDNKAITSILDKNMSIDGDITFTGKARIDGTINGNIKGEYLILSETASVKGDINAGVIICQGTVEGNIQSDKFFAKKPTNIVGKLKTNDLTVESGARINGEIQACISQKLSIVEPVSNTN